MAAAEPKPSLVERPFAEHRGALQDSATSPLVCTSADQVHGRKLMAVIAPAAGSPSRIADLDPANNGLQCAPEIFPKNRCKRPGSFMQEYRALSDKYS